MDLCVWVGREHCECHADECVQRCEAQSERVMRERVPLSLLSLLPLLPLLSNDRLTPTLRIMIRTVLRSAI